MREVAVGSILLFCVGCGGGSGPATDNAGAANTESPATLAEQLLESCVIDDLRDLSGLLDVVQGLLDADSGAPLPRFDPITGIRTGTFPWMLDIDEDGTDDLKGTLNLTDADGSTFSVVQLGTLLGNLVGGDLGDLDVFFAGLPDGTSINLGFEFIGALQSLNGDGNLSFTLDGGQIADVGGGASFDNGECNFDVDFNDISVDDLDAQDGFGAASIDFDLESEGSVISGSIELDGTNIAVITASLDGAPAEVFRLDLETGQFVE